MTKSPNGFVPARKCIWRLDAPAQNTAWVLKSLTRAIVSGLVPLACLVIWSASGNMGTDSRAQEASYNLAWHHDLLSTTALIPVTLT